MTTVLSSAARASSPETREHWYAGLTRKGIGLVLLLCVLNGLRRTIPNLFGDDWAFGPWLMDMLQLTAWGLIIAVPVTLAVVATYNVAPRRASLRYPALALAVALSCLLGVAVSTTVETYVQCSGPVEGCFDEAVR